MNRTVVVIGGGAAGIMATLAARAKGVPVLLLERNRRIGVKILISGGGRCNITHDASPKDLEKGFIPREGRFLRYSLHTLPPSEILTMLHREGVATYVRPNGRVFPQSGRADDVLAAFERLLLKSGATIRTSALVDGLQTTTRVVHGVGLGGETIDAGAVVVATGGLSYRKVGTTGDGIAWARKLGVRVEEPSAALAPIYFAVPPPSDWRGISLRDVEVFVEFDVGGPNLELPLPEGVPTTWRDDLVLTHKGLSGPSILEVSRSIAWGFAAQQSPRVFIDLVPDTTRERLRSLWNDRRVESPRSEVKSFVGEFMPRALVPWFLDMIKVDGAARISDSEKEVRARVVSGLKRWNPGLPGSVPIDRGEVTAGGIGLDAVDPRSMRVHDIDGLFAAGEALDIAGSVGGYNLQAAFSTGWVAGHAAATYVAGLSDLNSRAYDE